MTICIVIDISGSMSEIAKVNILRMILSCITVYNDPHFKFRYFMWHETLVETNANAPISTVGKADVLVLAQLLEDKNMLLLLTDGAFAMEEMGVTAMPNTKAIAIGGDADVYRLKRLVGNDNVYAPEDVFVALEDFIECNMA
jgi:hypothetical protein